MANLLCITELLNSAKSLVLAIIALVIIIFLVIVILKLPVGRKILGVMVCLLVVFTGFVTGYINYEYFTAHGGVFGTLENAFIKNGLKQENCRFIFENFNLVESKNKGEYIAEFKITNPNVSLKKKVIYVNDTPTKLQFRDDDYISCDYTYVYYDSKLNELANDTLNIKFFLSKKTRINQDTGEREDLDVSSCLLTSTGGFAKAKYWNKYLSKNDLIVEIKDEEKKETINVDNLPTYTVNLYVGDDVIKTYEVNYFTNAELPQEYLGEKIKEWVDDDGNIYTKAPLKNINLHAVFWPKYKVVLHIGDKIFDTIEFDQRVTDPGELPIYIGSYGDPEEYNALTVKSWKDINGNEYTKIPTTNIDLYAECYPAYHVNLCINDTIYKSYFFDEKFIYYFPTSVNDYVDYYNKTINWKDADGKIHYSTETLTSDINLYISIAEDPIESMNITFNSSTVTSFTQTTKSPKQYSDWCVKLTGEKIYFNTQGEYAYINNYFKKFLGYDSYFEYSGGQLYNVDIDITNLNTLNFHQSYNGKEAFNSGATYPFINFREFHLGCNATDSDVVVADLNFYLSYEEITSEYWIPVMYITYFQSTSIAKNPYGINNSTQETINGCKTQIRKECYIASEAMTFEVNFKIYNAD